MRGKERQQCRSILGMIYDKLGHARAWKRFKTEPRSVTLRGRKPKKEIMQPYKSGDGEQLGAIGNLTEEL